MRHWQRTIGIVGGLGPHAHVELERRLLAAVEAPVGDQDYPEWVVSSIPATPDRTEALLGGGPSPVSSLVRSLKRLEGEADFAIIACITAHAFLDEVKSRIRLPILDLVAVTLAEAARVQHQRGRIGFLATTGTLQSGLFPQVARRIVPGMELVTLTDLPSGSKLQERLVMQPIYGPVEGATRLSGGIKSGSDRDPRTGVLHQESLAQAVSLLGKAGATSVVLGCTEIAMTLSTGRVTDVPLLDPMQIAARVAIAIARGELPLP
jgi:aspartate racemase